MRLFTDLRVLPVLALLLGAFLPAGPAQAQQANPISLVVHVGFDGYYKEGQWLPIRVTLANDGPDFAGLLVVKSPRSDGNEVTFTREVVLPTQSRKELFLYTAPEGYLSQVRVVLSQGKNTVATVTAPVKQAANTDLLYGVVAGTPSAFAVLQLVDPLNGNGLVAQLSVDDLPPAAQAWKSLDALIFSDADTGGLDEAQRAALSGWIAGGGRLIVAGGPTWQKTAAGLSGLLPVEIAGTRTLTAFEALSDYARSSEALSGSTLIAAGPLADGASVAVSAGSQPLVVARPIGWGEVDFLAFDPGLDPFRGWDGMEGVYRNLLSTTEARPGWAYGFRNWYNAADALSAIPGLGLPNAVILCSFLGVYVLIVGPLNFLVLHRLKRREWAWITIPTTVVLFSAMAYIAGYGLRGTRPTLHRVSVVQVWPDSDQAHVDALVGVFSPRRTTYDLEIGGGMLVRPMPPGGSINTSLDQPMQQGETTVVEKLRVEIGGLQAYAAQGQIPAPRFESQLEFSVSGGSSVLVGTITNASDLDLRDAVVLAPGNVLRLGDFPAGATQKVNLTLAATRATPAIQTNAAVVLPAGAAPLYQTAGYYPYTYYGYGYDTTIDDILGSSYYYDDRALYRKYSLLYALMDPYSGAGRGASLALAGWTESSPLDADLRGRSFRAEDVTLWIVQLEPEVVVTGGQITIPPGLMSWRVVDPGTQGSATPYDAYLYQGYYSIQFFPTTPIEFSAASALILHLTSYGLTGPPGLEVALWDYSLGQFVPLSGLQWGDNSVSQPQQYVGPSGEIQARVTNPSFQNSISIENLDFTLVVER